MHVATTVRINSSFDLDEDYEFDESMVAIESSSKRHHIPKFCATCWSARASTLSALIGKYITVFETLGIIRDRSQGKARDDASSYMRLLEDSQFVVVLVVTQAILGFLSSANLALQPKTCDHAETYKDITAAKKCIQDKRNQTASDYYRINLYYPFIDHFIEELETRLSNEHHEIICRPLDTTKFT